MADYFLGSPIAGWTKNFLLTYADGDVEAELSARAILDTCESDLAALEYDFATSFQVGGRNEYATWVHVSNSGGGGSNRGWGDDESSVIGVNGTKPFPNRDEYARFVFVAELAEILMDFTGYGWNRGASNGEALSIFLATSLHGGAYYRTVSGPRVNQWLNANPRPDWIDATEGTDQNQVSYGCGLLFLYWLQGQLRYTTRQIVTKPSGTLAQVHAALTGQPNGFAAFRDLVERHLPTGFGVQVGSDNIFPLLDGRARSVYVQPSSSTISSTRKEPPRRITLDPGFICEPRDYDYWLVEEVEEVDVTATCRGFANARIGWSVNGVALAGGRGPTADSVRLPGDSVLTYPDGRKTTNPSKTIGVQYLVASSWNKSTLKIRNTEFLGITGLEIIAAAAEQAIGGDAGVSRTETWGLGGLVTEVEPRYSEDRRSCNPQFQMIDRSVLELAERIYVLIHTPDPAPELLVAVTRALERLRALADEAAESTGISAERIVDEALASIRPETISAPAAAPAAATSMPMPRMLVGADGLPPVGVDGAIGQSPWIAPARELEQTRGRTRKSTDSERKSRQSKPK
ncbi:MAG TPA: hypothetical protein VFS32_02700 [Candidatus Limnocylindrales bacterium]|nr:hypothetical protein [Candidatus Limnocylindrales bacterium]